MASANNDASWMHWNVGACCDSSLSWYMSGVSIVGGLMYDSDMVGCFYISYHDAIDSFYWLGACDQLYNQQTGFKCAGCGERVGYPKYMGFTSTALFGIDYGSFYIGACDWIWVDGSGFVSVVLVDGYMGAEIDTIGSFRICIRARTYIEFDVGASYCDLFWIVLSGIRYVTYGGGCGHGSECGTSFLALPDAPWMAFWYIGACDHIFNQKFLFGMFGTGGMQRDREKDGFVALTFHPEWDSIYYFGA